MPYALRQSYSASIHYVFSLSKFAQSKKKNKKNRNYCTLQISNL